MFDLSGKTAIVTGGSRGIGRGVCEALARQGAKVVVGFGANEAAAHEVVKTIAAAGGQAEAARIDVADTPGAEAAVSELAKRLGRLDVLVANAGISIDALLLRMKDDDFDRTLAVNLKGAIATARAAIKTMMRARSGRIVFVSSIVGEAGNAGQVAYAASKAGIIGAMKCLAREYASRSITVNVVSPGYVDTDMTRGFTDEQRKAMLAGIPLGRVGSVGDVAAAVAYLASDEAAYVTGQTLRVNGGMYV